MIEAAIEQGVSILCFTDHVDIDFPEVQITFDTAEYMEYFKKLNFDVYTDWLGQSDTSVGGSDGHWYFWTY